MTGLLYIVGTPIGNLGDITLRSIEIFNQVDLICAEDTRRTRQLLSHLNIQKKIISYFEHSSANKENEIIKKIKEGMTIALVSDAGTPGISDPGMRLVANARKHEIEVIPIPGVSALTTAVSVSGMPTQPFHFWGFLSPKLSKRKKVYEVVLSMEGSHMVYASPYKIEKLLDEWEKFLPDCFFFIGREMTKKFESYHYGNIEAIKRLVSSDKIKGEFTVIFSKKEL